MQVPLLSRYLGVQVQLAAGEALKRMQVADMERNAILGTFR